MCVTTAQTALLAATAVHLGFQVTVTTLVYPALARADADHWPAAHRSHSRAITPLVGVVYAALALTGGWALLSPGRSAAWTDVAVAALVATALTTVLAARIHTRLGAGHDPGQIDLLLRVDRARAITAVLAFLAMAVAAF